MRFPCTLPEERSHNVHFRSSLCGSFFFCGNFEVLFVSIVPILYLPHPLYGGIKHRRRIGSAIRLSLLLPMGAEVVSFAEAFSYLFLVAMATVFMESNEAHPFCEPYVAAVLYAAT